MSTIMMVAGWVSLAGLMALHAWATVWAETPERKSFIPTVFDNTPLKAEFPWRTPPFEALGIARTRGRVVKNGEASRMGIQVRMVTAKGSGFHE